MRQHNLLTWCRMSGSRCPLRTPGATWASIASRRGRDRSGRRVGVPQRTAVPASPNHRRNPLERPWRTPMDGVGTRGARRGGRRCSSGVGGGAQPVTRTASSRPGSAETEARCAPADAARAVPATSAGSPSPHIHRGAPGPLEEAAAVLAASGRAQPVTCTAGSPPRQRRDRGEMRPRRRR